MGTTFGRGVVMIKCTNKKCKKYDSDCNREIVNVCQECGSCMFMPFVGGKKRLMRDSGRLILRLPLPITISFSSKKESTVSLNIGFLPRGISA